jgi:hypothetical protein
VSVNTTGLGIDASATPISPASVSFVAPTAGEHIAASNARSYEVRWTSQHLDADSGVLEIALDSARPRRLLASSSQVTLGLLLPVAEELGAGEHWLFAAPVTASGLLASVAPGAPRSAVALRFVIGAGAPSAGSGVVWLRRPEGTYNGASAEHVLFDAQAFDANGTALATPCTFYLRGKRSGELGFPGAFWANSLASGDYEISASAANAAPSPTQTITVNAELGGPK